MPQFQIIFLRIGGGNRPEQAVLTHFGMQMIFKGLTKEARLIEEKTRIPTIAAVDGMRLNFGYAINIEES